MIQPPTDYCCNLVASPILATYITPTNRINTMYTPNAHVTSSHINKKRRTIDKLDARIQARAKLIKRLHLISDIIFYTIIGIAICAMLTKAYISY